MRQILLPAVLALGTATALPAVAQDDDKSEGLSLMERGARLLLKGLMEDVEPVIDDFRTMAEEFGPQMQAMMDDMGPAFEALLKRIDSISYYEAPELLPNGDIILRRRADAPPYEPPVAAPPAEIEL